MNACIFTPAHQTVISTPTIHIHRTPDNYSKPHTYRLELDGTSVGPVIRDKNDAQAIADWLESAWSELP